MPTVPSAESVPPGLDRLVDPGTLARAVSYHESGRVLEVQVLDGGLRVFGRVAGQAREPYSAFATLTRAADGVVTSLAGQCTCPVRRNCKHAVALVLAAQDPAETAHVPPPAVPDWQAPLARLLGAPADGVWEPLGLQVEVTVPPETGRAATGSVHIALRPVVRGARGTWIRTGISWAELPHANALRRRFDPVQVRLLDEIQRLDSTRSAWYRPGRGAAVRLDELGTPRIWDVLRDARRAGLPIVGSDRSQTPVTVDEPAAVALDVSRGDAGLTVAAAILVEGIPLRDNAVPLGDPAHGLLLWPAGTGLERAVDEHAWRLVPLEHPAGAEWAALLGRDTPLRIPAAEEQAFLRDYYPRLRHRVRIASSDGSFAPPEDPPPVLELRVRYAPGDRATLDWSWRYTVSGVVHALPLHAPLRPSRREEAGDADLRDPAFERDVLAGLGLDDTPALLESGLPGGRLAARAQLTGYDTIEFATRTTPVLEASPHVRLHSEGTAVDYRPATDTPVVHVAVDEGPDRDWLDLAVTVTVDGETVPLPWILTAMAKGESHLALVSGTYFALDLPVLRRLAALVAEARELQDPKAPLQLSRYQASLWDDLEALGVVDRQAEAWRHTVRALTGRETVERVPVPRTLTATLRPYQRDGFDWLAFLADRGLGGILADDMGLGKTIQTLALICRSRARQPGAAPFLVVAPTSVVPNWVHEAQRFAPGLDAVAIDESTARRGRSVAEAVAGADVVVVSYTLFRLEFAQYEALPWSGLVLDEAHAVKNRQSKAHRCARLLPAPFKLAITGTPIENDLMELWSLLSITDPGLFPSPTRFTDVYQKPIERGHDAGRLALLRRRIAPFLLRRTKDQVARSLPAKQEQVVELELNPRHRRVYDTHLQRERQKLLGLIEDLDRNRFTIFQSLTLLRRLALDAGLVDAKYADVPSTKLDAVMIQLGDIISAGHRVLVFSQFTSFLAKTRDRLESAGIDFCYLDGTTRNRGAVIKEFQAGTAPVFLISLKAGGVGLNLTAADYCIILDPWWNPAAEAQAVDRAHRIGQTRPVTVYRLVAKGTIEEKVMALKAAKARLFDDVLAVEGSDGPTSGRLLTAADIRGLLS